MNQGDGDKRKVSTDALETLGNIIDEREKRDAIHLAVCPVVAQEKLFPGQDVGPDGTTANPVGIVDPFLKTPVFPGQRFWLVIYPRQISSLRHVWSHPAFPDEVVVSKEEHALFDKDESAIWIKNYASELGVQDYDLMIAADEWVKSDGCEYYIGDGDNGIYDKLEGISTNEEFWFHYQSLRKTVIRPHLQTNFFSCSC